MPIKVIRGERKPAAYLQKASGYVYIPRAQSEGGGVWSSSGKFSGCSYTNDCFSNIAYEPLYAGDKLEIVTEVVLL